MLSRKDLQALLFENHSYPIAKYIRTEAEECPESWDLPPLTPSEYEAELGLTTESRLTLLCKQQSKLLSVNSDSELKIVPPVVVFQKFVPFERYSVIVQVQNVSNRMQKLQIRMDNTPEIFLDPKELRVGKFAPGMLFKLSIYFEPLEDKDYCHYLSLATEGRKLRVPIIAIGSRGILRVPDKIDFGEVAVKSFCTKTVTGPNVGQRSCRVYFSTGGPFCVSPEQGCVDGGKSLAIEVSIYSNLIGIAQGLLKMEYDNGDVVEVKLCAEIVSGGVEIITRNLCWPLTYVGLASCTSLIILNGTSSAVAYQWKKYNCHYSDTTYQRKSEIASKRNSERDGRKESANDKKISFDIRIAAKRQTVRTECEMESGKKMMEVDPIFGSDSFRIEPCWGKIEPCSKTECLVIFSPTNPGLHTVLAHCEIIGMEERFPVSFVAEGLAPAITYGGNEIKRESESVAENITSELVTDEAIFEMTIGGQPAGNIKIGLFGQTVPRTVKNFATICSQGIDGKSYAGSPFHRVIKQFMVQGGDIVRGDGTGSTSIYGGRFDDENFNIKHTGPGFLSMANSGPNTNGCQFFITVVPTPWLDDHHVVFGKVVEGFEVVKTIENNPTGANDRPVSPVMVNRCTLNTLDQPYDLPLGTQQ